MPEVPLRYEPTKIIEPGERLHQLAVGAENSVIERGVGEARRRDGRAGTVRAELIPSLDGQLDHVGERLDTLLTSQRRAADDPPDLVPGEQLSERVRLTLAHCVERPQQIVT